MCVFFFTYIMFNTKEQFLVKRDISKDGVHSRPFFCQLYSQGHENTPTCENFFNLASTVVNILKIWTPKTVAVTTPKF